LLSPVQNLLDAIGSLFVYRNPPPLTGKRLLRFRLMGLPNSKLRKLVPTTSHYSKAKLVAFILEKKSSVELEELV
jgi:hypothetical protein